MGIIRLTLISAIVVGGAMLWFGREDGLPENRLGRERVASPEVVTPASRPEPTPQPQPQPQPTPEPQPTPAPQPQPAPIPQPQQQPDPEPIPAPQPEPIPDPEPQPEPDPAPVATLPVLYVTGSKVNMREGPSTSDGIVAALLRGTAVDDLGEAAPGWSAIRVVETGEIGYMATRFLSPEQP